MENTMSWGLEAQIKELKEENTRLREALKPFAALVHEDGVEAPYPEEWWNPRLIAAMEALDKDRKV
jgi:hypothetical protein